MQSVVLAGFPCCKDSPHQETNGPAGALDSILKIANKSDVTVVVAIEENCADWMRRCSASNKSHPDQDEVDVISLPMTLDATKIELQSF